MNNESIKDNIFRIRNERNFTQEEVADRLGISTTAYRELERGKTAILSSRFLKLADILDVSVEELILGFIPIRSESKAIEDVRAEYGGKTLSLEARIEELENINKVLENSLRDKEEMLRDKNEIITMLKKRLGNEN